MIGRTVPGGLPDSTGAPLDTGAVRRLYLDGDFDQAVEMLETGLREKRVFGHDDSAFIFKHLGVMYAAKYETRERGKHYMHLLLTVEPTARILDMYASDMIYMIFKNIQDEFEETRGKLARAESHAVGNSQSPIPSRGSHAIYWVGATTVAVGAGIAAYFLLAEQPANTKDHPIE